MDGVLGGFRPYFVVSLLIIVERILHQAPGLHTGESGGDKVDMGQFLLRLADRSIADSGGSAIRSGPTPGVPWHLSDSGCQAAILPVFETETGRNTRGTRHLPGLPVFLPCLENVGRCANGFAGYQPLMPSVAMPSTRYFWKTMNTMMTGISDTTDMAKRPP